MDVPTALASSELAQRTMDRSDFPALHIAASDISRRGQLSYKRWVKIHLFLLVVVAILGAVSGWVTGAIAPIFSFAIVAALLGAMATGFANGKFRGDRDWFDGRAVAESVKTNVWRYMMRVPPFGNDRTCDRAFATRLKAILIENKNLNQTLASLPSELHQITDRMHEVRRLDWLERREFYLRERLVSEIRWYRTKAAAAGVAATRWMWASFAAESTGVLIALSTFVLPIEVMMSLVGVVAAIAAAFEAWNQLGRHTELSHSYAMACQELVTIRDLMLDATTEPAFITAVKNSEGAISREHTMWVAKRSQ